MNPQEHEILRTLHTAIAPTILISGTGLLLLSVNNRYMKIVDRVRQLAQKIQGIAKHRDSIEKEIAILLARARGLRTCICLMTLSLIFTTLLIILIFSLSLMKLDLSASVAVCFSLAAISLIFGITYFMHDVTQSLKALKIATRIPKSKVSAK